MKNNEQSSIFKGIYEFEDPSGTLIAAKIPHIGSVDLFAGTAVIVKPNQCAFLLYKGSIADVLLEGTHEIKTENVPILTRLANWKFGLKSPLRAELWYFSSQVYLGRRWGTSAPVLHEFTKSQQAVPIRGFGNYNIVLKDPKKFYSSLIGSKTSFDITELEEFVQGQIVELFAQALGEVQDLTQLGKSHNKVSKTLQQLVNGVLAKYGFEVKDLQVLSLLPSQEVIKALDAKAAMGIIGNKQEYLLYQAANSLSELQGGDKAANDPMQMMLGMMLGKGLMGADYKEKEREKAVSSLREVNPSNSLRGKFCSACGSAATREAKFCSACGGKI